jgi:hypothetical protein
MEHIFSALRILPYTGIQAWITSTVCTRERIDMRQHSQKHQALYRHRFLLIHRNYTVLWVGSTISFIGDVLFMTVLTLWIGTLLHNQSCAPLPTRGNGGQR